jgi:hypothetical protein
MTVSAGFYPTDVFPPSFNLGALFGFRASPQPSWRYEPPSLPRNITPLDFRTLTLTLCLLFGLTDVSSLSPSTSTLCCRSSSHQ